MIEYERRNLNGVPDFTAAEFEGRRSDYCLLIPVINEGARILMELGRAQTAGIDRVCDIVICDGGSTDGSMKHDTLQLYHVNTLLTKTGPGKQGARHARQAKLPHNKARRFAAFARKGLRHLAKAKARAAHGKPQ